MKKFPFGYVIECNKNGHIHNTGFCETVKQAYDKWNDHPTEKERQDMRKEDEGK